ncbi:MAG: thiol reductase thioredoxin [Planctomycetes bacterium]|nr:thiol reductase thioredoxin [Planctomycetota bacterium]
MSGNVAEFTDANFETDVTNSDQPVLVDFWAPWCGPCKLLTPTIEAIAEDFSGKVRVGKMNTDENPRTASDMSWAARLTFSSSPVILSAGRCSIADRRAPVPTLVGHAVRYPSRG